MMSRIVLVLFNIILFSSDLSHAAENCSERIVGGIEADIEEFPYQVSLRFNGGHICGGSIISSKLIVTAAHCTDRDDASKFTVRVGSSLHTEGGEIYEVERVDIHPDYDLITIDYDVSVLQLKTALKFSSTVKSIEILNEAIGTNHFVVVSGWGTIAEGGSASETLLQVYVPLVSDDDCKEFYGKNEITDSMICAGYPEGGHDSCQGDSGGPLVYKDKLIGIVSWGFGCARPGYPGVYTSVLAVRSYLASFLEHNK